MEPTHDSSSGRSETPAERSDRNWNDLLQEFRVLQTGVQILGGFLLTLPFHERFEQLDQLQRGLYLALVVLAATCTALMLAPIATHRRLFRQQRKHLLVAAGHRLASVVMILIGLLVTGIATFVFDVVVGRAAALAVGGTMLLLNVVTLTVLPRIVERRPSDTPSESSLR